VNRTRAIFALLVPVMLLIASSSFGLDRPDGSANYCLSSAVSVDTHCSDDYASPLCSFDQSVRRWSRRFNDQSAEDGFLSLLVRPGIQPANLDRVSGLSNDLHHAPELANCWQFRWRTALDPRAPSLIS